VVVFYVAISLNMTPFSPRRRPLPAWQAKGGQLQAAGALRGLMVEKIFAGVLPTLREVEKVAECAELSVTSQSKDKRMK
jgi:hypothetical protein